MYIDKIKGFFTIYLFWFFFLTPCVIEGADFLSVIASWYFPEAAWKDQPVPVTKENLPELAL